MNHLRTKIRDVLNDYCYSTRTDIVESAVDAVFAVLHEQESVPERRIDDSDYSVGWNDCISMLHQIAAAPPSVDAHELWVVAQLFPGEGIEDGVDRITALLAVPTPPSVPEWIRVVDEEMVCSHLGVANASDDYETAKAKLNQLIQWHITVATDPAVNGGYVLVPAVPTDEMLKSVQREMGWCDPVGIFSKMLKTAPKPEPTP